MRRLLAIIQTPAILMVSFALPAVAHSRPPRPLPALNCNKMIKVTGKRVAIRDEPKAGAPIVTKVKRGDILWTCFIAIGRNKPYTKCGIQHYDWYLVNTGTPRSGYLPITCARKL